VRSSVSQIVSALIREAELRTLRYGAELRNEEGRRLSKESTAVGPS
jgi:hypothetical protein